MASVAADCGGGEGVGELGAVCGVDGFEGDVGTAFGGGVRLGASGGGEGGRVRWRGCGDVARRCVGGLV